MSQIPSYDRAPDCVSVRWRLGQAPWQQIPPVPGRRARAIVDNDFAGDPDDLPQLVHQLLTTNVATRLVVASHLAPGDHFDPSDHTAQNAERIVRDVFTRMGLESTDVIVRGSDARLPDRETPAPSPAVDAIVAEAMRDDDSPLFYLAGGGLTDLASALLVEPRIAERMTVIWIGGNEHDDLASPPPNAMPIEYNLLIDVAAAQVVFGDSGIPIWQVPRDVYRQCLVSDAELRIRMAATGPLGRYMYDEIAAVFRTATGFGAGPAETYALGDSPLVLLSSLQSLFEADTSSSAHVVRPTPAIADDGSYVPVAGARPMRVYTRVDTRLMLEDFFLKLAEFERWATPRA
ncbi:nucleoside hydrolase [Microbacterium halophytorum]|uniref:nucleoside hydrolase n=1 Tax=Microbacterium halophytorum TaxID=2067568 RepID=UPI0015740030|nr:nucleoside hydrolase [Microbacterium halophytorum]